MQNNTAQPNIKPQLEALADHLCARDPAILEAWRAAVNNNLDLTTGSGLSATLFNDHIPVVLDAFAHRLRAWPDEVSDALHQQENTQVSFPTVSTVGNRAFACGS